MKLTINDTEIELLGTIQIWSRGVLMGELIIKPNDATHLPNIPAKEGNPDE